MDIEIRPASIDDAARIAAIYNHYILNTHITFETDTVDAEQMSARITEISELGLPWLIAESDNDVVGYAYASRWKQRRAYEHTVESTIYLDETRQNNGIGIPLYGALINELIALRKHSVIGGISLPNKSSVRFHERFGFEKAGHLDEVGFKQGRWIDVGYWQLRL